MEKQTKEKIKELKKQGKTCKEVSDQLQIPYSNCLYYYNEDYKKKAIEKAKQWTKANPDKLNKDRIRVYQKKYSNDYYHSPENHERLKEYYREYQRKRYNSLKL
jgi:hypothetical protein